MWSWAHLQASGVFRSLFLNELLGLFGYPSESARALLAGTLPLRHCTARFAGRIPAWRLPVSGHVACLVTADHEVSFANGDEVSSREVLGLWFWTRTEKNSTEQKNPCTPRWFSDSMSSTGVEEIASSGAFACFHP